MLAATLLGLALVGLIISSYFTAVAYRWVAPDAPWVPPVCRLDEGTCATVVDTPRARVFGVPNSVLGQLWYVALAGGVLTGAVDRPALEPWFLAGSLATVLLGLYLTWSLLFVTRVNCRLCFASHALNGLVFVLLLV